MGKTIPPMQSLLGTGKYIIVHACLQKHAYINLLQLFSTSHYCHNTWCLLEIYSFTKKINHYKYDNKLCRQFIFWTDSLFSEIKIAAKAKRNKHTCRHIQYICTLMHWLSHCALLLFAEWFIHTHTHHHKVVLERQLYHTRFKIWSLTAEKCTHQNTNSSLYYN